MAIFTLLRKPLWNALATVVAATITSPGGRMSGSRALTTLTSLRLETASSSSSSPPPSSSVAAPVVLQELELSCSDGTRLAAQLWKREQQQSHSRWRTVLCLHGWMDNCRSFYWLAPFIANGHQKNNNNCNNNDKKSQEVEFQVVALDLPGHGRSSHKSKDAPPMVQAEMVFYVHEAIEQLFLLQRKQAETEIADATTLTTSTCTTETTTVTLIGHSLGAGIASLYAASFPERVDQLVLLDGAGFLPREARDTSFHVRNHVLRRRQAYLKEQQQEQQQRLAKPTRGYPSLEAAISRRRQSMKALPGGNQTLSYEAARELVIRATHLDPRHHHDNTTNHGEINIDMEDNNNNSNNSSSSSSSTNNPDSKPSIQFRHDGRFAWPSIQYMTQDQNEGIFRVLGGGVIKNKDQEGGRGGVDCGIYIARDGWPFGQDRVDRALALIRPREFEILPGSHYFHADPESSPAVASSVVNFLASYSPSPQ